MKKVLASVLAVASIAAAGSVYAGIPAQTGVNGSLHDMRMYAATKAGAGYADVHVDSMDRVCVFCHTPHNSIKPGGGDTSDYPLWNRVTDATLNYEPYKWATQMNKGTTDVDNVGEFDISAGQAIFGPSRLCLTCHDGTLAVDSHSGSLTNAFGNGAQNGGIMVSDRAKIGQDLSNDHPIGFNYNDIRLYRESHSLGAVNANGDHEIAKSDLTFATSVTPTAVGGTAYNDVQRQGAGGRTIKDVLYQGQIMTCATCHEVHNKDNAKQANLNGVNGSDASAAPNFFLYAPEKDSLICLSCHVK